MTVITTQPPQFSHAKVQEIIQSHYGLEVSVSALDSERDQNFQLKGKNGDNFVLKFSNPLEDLELIQLQTAALLHISKFDGSLNVPIPIKSIDGSTIQHIDGNIIRVQSFLKGSFIKDVENPSANLLNDFGKFLGKLDLAFMEFDYPKIDRDWVWDIRNIAFLKDHLTYLPNQTDQKIVGHFIKSYESNIYPIKKFLRRQYIHNDGNDHNVLLNDFGEISGIIDFGDMAHTFLACELAVAVSYLILEDENPQEKIKTVGDGYQSILPLREEEIDSLIYLICMRACLTVVTANYRKKLFPDNEYISVTEPKAWKFLRNMADKNLKDFKI
jgi:Ser/Thr protein kinase RdoA (MazF antagonist)